MKVVFGIPVLEGGIKARCHQSLIAAYQLLQLRGIPYDEQIIENCPCISVARNMLAARVMDDVEVTDLQLVDSDVGFPPEAVLALLERPEDIVAGVYPLKRDSGGFPVKIKTQDGIPVGRDGLIEGLLMPTGFMRIKRRVFELMAQAHPELKYEDSVVWVDDEALRSAYDFFGMGIYGRTFRTEDFAFCQRWRDMGGQLWVYPDIDFHHVGQKAWPANYHQHLLRLPGGAKSALALHGALETPGFMEPQELIWLAAQAKIHKCIVELGSFLGRSTRALADNTSGVVYAVDDWNGLRDQDWPSELAQEINENFKDNCLLGFTHHLKDHIEAGKVRPVNADHGLKEWWPPFPDMVFVDGDHRHENVRRDIVNALDRLAPGGLLCGHDSNWPGVTKAVTELLPDAVMVPDTTIWAYVLPMKEVTSERLPEEVHA